MADISETPPVLPEVSQFRRLSSAVMGYGDNLNKPEINLHNFDKYILIQGTTVEKRALISCLEQTVYLKNKELTTEL